MSTTSTMERLEPTADVALTPKVVIVSMFDLEAETWLKREEPKFDLLVKIPGLNPKYPDVLVTKDGSVCLLTTGESLLNASLAITALTSSPCFDLRESYFLVSGIAGVNPKRATLGSVAFPRFAVQVDLQYEFDAREIPDDWNTGYVPQGASEPGQYPKILYGTEVYELNNDLRTKILDCARRVDLDDSEAASNYRARYAGAPGDVFNLGAMKPSVVDGDVASANVFFHGHLLGQAVEEFVDLITNGRGSYSMTQQEDNATLGALLRSTLQGRADFSRIIIMRAGSNFDRSINDTKRPAIPLHVNHGGLNPSLENLYRVGRVVVKEIIDGWEPTYRKGIKPTNYIGDIFGALGGTPDFGPATERA